METKVEALEDNKAQLTVTVPAADVDALVKKTYKDFAHKYNFPGFRKGKAPRKVVDNLLGAEFVLATVTEEIVNEYYVKAVDAEQLSVVGSPDFAEPGMVEGGKDFTFSVTVTLKPQVELTSYEPVAIELPFESATEADIEAQLKSMREYYKTFEDASAATKVKAENTADLAFKATDEEGNAIASLESEGRLWTPGNGMFPAAFDAEIMGMKKGQVKEFTIEVPADDASVLMSSFAGKKVNFEITCNVVKKEVVPELTEEWVKETMGFESIEALKDAIVQSHNMQLEEVLPRITENNCITALIERLEGEVPAAMVEDAESALLQDFFTQMQRQNVSFDTYLAQRGIDNTQFKADIKAEATDNVKQELALDAWARVKGLEVTAEEISNEFVVAGLENPAAVEAEWRANGRIRFIREGLLRSKAMQDIIDTAVITRVDYAAKDAE